MLGGLTRHDPRAKATQPIEGVTEWDNPRNRVHVVELHYTADPAKRTPEWEAEARVGFDRRGFDREFNIKWEIPDGLAVFPEYEAASMRRPVDVIPNARLYRFWDFGHVCPVTLFAQVDLYGRLRILAELVLENESLEQQIASTLALSMELMGQPRPPVFDAGDPAGEKEMDLGSVRNVLMHRGILLHCQPSNAGSYENLRQRLLRRVHIEKEGQSPALLVDPRCSLLHDALAGCFHRNSKTNKIVDEHPYKDVCDALRYGNDNLVGLQSDFMAQMREASRRDQAW